MYFFSRSTWLLCRLVSSFLKWMYFFSRSTWPRRCTKTTSNGWRCRPDSSCRGVSKIRRSTTESTTPRSSFVPSSSTRSSGPSREPSRTNISKSRILRGRQSLTTPKIGNLKSATTTTSTLINVTHFCVDWRFCNKYFATKCLTTFFCVHYICTFV